MLSREYPHIFFASQGSTLIFMQCRKYPHFLVIQDSRRALSSFVQILGVGRSFFFAIQGGRHFSLHMQMYRFLQTKPILAWPYPVLTHFVCVYKYIYYIYIYIYIYIYQNIILAWPYPVLTHFVCVYIYIYI